MEEIVYIRGDSKKIRIVTGTRRFKFKDLICEVCNQKMEVEEDRCDYRLMHCTYCDDYKIQIGEEQIIWKFIVYLNSLEHSKKNL